MSEKMRGALFNALGDIEGLTFLDAFAGSGALSFEAISRGAKSAIAVEIEKDAHETMKRSIQELKLREQIKAVRANIAGWSIHNMEHKYDVVLLDPPHDNIRPNLLQKLMNRHVKDNGLAVLSYPGHAKVPEFDRMKVVADKNYGDAQLIYYRPYNKA